jgi:hypothetical protein
MRAIAFDFQRALLVVCATSRAFFFTQRLYTLLTCSQQNKRRVGVLFAFSFKSSLTALDFRSSLASGQETEVGIYGKKKPELPTVYIRAGIRKD